MEKKNATGTNWLKKSPQDVLGSLSRRDILKSGLVGIGAIGATSLLSACGAGSGGSTGPAQASAATAGGIEKGATLNILRWVQFVDADKKLWLENTKKFTEKTGVPVNITWETWTNINAKAATAIRSRSGPDIIFGFYDLPQEFSGQTLDISDVAEAIGQANGGWFDTARKYGTYDGKWIGMPLCVTGAEWLYRKSWFRDAGVKEFPKTTDELLSAARKLNAAGHPIGLALGHSVGDAQGWTHWLLWSFGGRTVDKHDKVVINSKETLAALSYAKELYQEFIPGTTSWGDSNNNRVFLGGKISATTNGISIYFSAKKQSSKLARDIGAARAPIGPVGKPTELSPISQAMVLKYSKFPKAASAYLKFMWEKEQYVPWMKATDGYAGPPLQDYADDPFWKTNPVFAAYQYGVRDMLWDGYSGTLGQHSSQALHNFIVVDMVAKAASGQQSPQDAINSAESALKQIYGG